MANKGDLRADTYCVVGPIGKEPFPRKAAAGVLPDVAYVRIGFAVFEEEANAALVVLLFEGFQSVWSRIA